MGVQPVKKYTVEILLTLAVLGGSFSVAHGEERLIYANGWGWTTTVVATADKATNASLSDCRIGPAPSTSIPANGAGILTPFLCNPSPFQALPVPTGVSAFTVLRFGGLSYTVPPVGSVSGSVSQRALITTGAGQRAYLVGIPDKHAQMTAIFFNGANEQTGRQYINIDPPAAVVELETDNAVGFVVITSGYAALTPPDGATTYGFISVSSPDGGAARVVPFRSVTQ